MTVNQLNIVRDCWWTIGSGTTIPNLPSIPTKFTVTDEAGNLPSQHNGVFKSLNANDGEYIEIKGSGILQYVFKTESSNQFVDGILVSLRASGNIVTDTKMYVNELDLGSFDAWNGISTQEKLFELSTSDKLNGVYQPRVNENYSVFQVHFHTPPTSGESVVRIYDLEVSYSGDGTWNNHETGLPNVLSSYHYPNSLGFRDNSIWINQAGSTVDSSGYYHINDSGIINRDTQYIEQQYIGDYTKSLYSVKQAYKYLPKGGLSLYFDNNYPSGLDPLGQITRAQINLRMSLPSSGQNENEQDSFVVQGYNYKMKDQDYKVEMPEAIGSIKSKDNLYGYYTYGAGEIIAQSGFKNYNVELNFLDPYLNTMSSITNRNIDTLANTEFQLIGLPSGVQLSNAILYLEYIPNDTVPLYVCGVANRCSVSTFVDTGGTHNPLLGNGAWQHRGNVNEATIFDAFYDFSEASGQITWPLSLNSASGSYGEYVNTMPETLVEGIDTVEPQRSNYYRNPIITGFGEVYDPTYYRNMIYNGSAFLPWNVHDPDRSLYPTTITEVYFGDRIVLGTDFTLYMMLYRQPTNDGQCYGRIFQRGAFGFDGETNYEIIGSLETEQITFTIIDNVGVKRRVSVDIPYSTIQPILIWVTCYYNTTTNVTTFGLNVHTDIQRYFNSDWLHDEISFEGARKQNPESKTCLGTMWTPPTLTEQTLYNSLLNFVSFVEFGWADSYIELDYATSTSTVINDYDISTSIDKRFFASRVCNSNYLLGKIYTPNTIGGESIPAEVNSSGWIGAGSSWNESSLNPWYNINNITALDGSYAFKSLGTNPMSPIGFNLVAYNFDFNIPPSATIVGCEARIHGYAYLDDVTSVDTYRISLCKKTDSYYRSYGTNQVTSGPTSWPQTLGILSYGSQSNTWGIASGVFTPDFVNDENFGVAILPYILGTFAYNNTTAYIDYIEMKIYTTEETFLSSSYAGVNFEVPTGSGIAEWNTKYSIDEWIDTGTYHSIYNPITTAGTNNLVHPSAIYVEITTEHNTDHPSGVYIDCDIEFDSGSTDNWKVLRTGLNVPSGGLTTQTTSFSKHINMYGEPIRLSDVDSISLNLRTKYIDIADQQYYGDLKINSVKVYFDSYCVATTGSFPGIDNIDLFIEGSAQTLNSDVDLFIKVHESASFGDGDDTLDLYIYGLAHSASGDIVPLYIKSDNYVMPPIDDPNVTNMPLYINGLTPGYASGDTTFYMWATPVGVGGMYKSTPLFISGMEQQYRLPLYISGPSHADCTQTMPLYLESHYDSINDNVDLVILGPSGINDSTTYLYIRGLGTTDGAYPYNNRMPLFIARDSESVASIVSLYIAQYNVIDNVDMYIEGNEVASSSTPLYISGSGVGPNKSMKLYTHGF